MCCWKILASLGESPSPCRGAGQTPRASGCEPVFGSAGRLEALQAPDPAAWLQQALGSLALVHYGNNPKPWNVPAGRSAAGRGQTAADADRAKSQTVKGPILIDTFSIVVWHHFEG